MSYIEKEKLIKADIASIENRVRHAFNQGYDLGYKEGKANRSEIPTGSTTKNDLGVDCISRQEVLRLLANSIGKTNTYLQTEVLKMSSVTLQESRWIPVSERLPDYGDYVLVTVSIGLAKSVDIDFYSVVEKEGFEGYGKDVIAWMPLPKGYREVKE